MTSHTGLTHEQEPFTMTIDLPAFLDALVADLKSGSAPTPWLTYNELANALTKARARLEERPTPALGWSEWLDWAGGPCPLPGETPVQFFAAGDRTERADVWYWPMSHKAGCRLRYREQYPGGWLPRGDFIPPAALWDEACPVRLEWTCTLSESGVPGRAFDTDWKGVNFIRLRPREKAGEMPDGWFRSVTGSLIAPDGNTFLRGDAIDRYGPDTIRRAVDAWLASMKERGNG